MNQQTKISYEADDINYFNGFRNASKLLNALLQYLQQAIDEVPDDKFKDTAIAWRRAAERDVNKIISDMYRDLKDIYGMRLRIAPDDTYYLGSDMGNAEEN